LASPPKMISTSDSMFLRINGVLSPSFSMVISDFVKETPNNADSEDCMRIEYFLQPTFG
jgi:hypothetical protein